MISAIDAASRTQCGRFQRIAWDWLQSGEITRTAHMLSPIEELAGFNYGFIYLLAVDAQCVKIGYLRTSYAPAARMRAQYGSRLRLRACFVGNPPAERFAHRRFASLRIRNELFYAHPLIDTYFQTSRERMREETPGSPRVFPAVPATSIRASISECSARGSRASIA